MASSFKRFLRHINAAVTLNCKHILMFILNLHKMHGVSFSFNSFYCNVLHPMLILALIYEALADKLNRLHRSKFIETEKL